MPRLDHDHVSWLVLVALLVSLLTASCTSNEPAADNDKRGGFYGGINGGGVWP